MIPKLAKIQEASSAEPGRRWYWRVVFGKAIALTVWEGVALAAFAALFGVSFPHYAEAAFVFGVVYIVAAPLIDQAWAAAMMRWGGDPAPLAFWARVLSVVAAGIIFKLAGYLAFYSMASAIYVDLGSRDVAADIVAIQTYRNLIAPVGQFLSGYADDIIVGLATTAIGALIAGIFRR